VAENGVSETVWTSSIFGAGPVGVGGVGVVSVSVGAVVVAAGVSPGSARKVSGRSTGGLNSDPTEGVSVAEPGAAAAIDRASAVDNGWSPGLEPNFVCNAVGTYRRPPGGANLSAGAASALADAADTGVPSDPGRAIRKPMVEPAKTASSSQQTVRRGTR
jgi:hypothetical protein